MSADETNWKRRALAAEETTRVLKEKVLELYDGKQRSAMHSALEKARERDERNRRKRELMEVRTAELTKHNERLEGQVAERTRAIRAILDNVTFGFLRIDADLVIQEGVTKSCEGLLGRMPEAGERLPDLLRLSDDEAANLQLGVEQVFDDFMPPEVTLQQMPSRFELDGRVLLVEGRVIEQEDGSVDSLLFSISDITDLEEARRRNRERDVLIGVMRSKPAFEEFVADTRFGLEAAIEGNSDVALVRRYVHTVKGNAASWGLDELTELLHGLEENEALDPASLDTISAALGSFLDKHRDLLGLDYEISTPGYEVSGEDLRQLGELLDGSDQMDEFQTWLSNAVRRPAAEIIGPMDSFVAKLAERLGKDVTFELHGGELLVDAERMRPILRNLSHLIRNAVDHGIEDPELRGDKPARSRLLLSVEESDDAWTFTVQDDGRGISHELVAAAAIRGGFATEEQVRAMSDDEKQLLIFQDGLSTRAEVTDVSGRGVGMSAVREAVRKQGGEVAIETSADGTTVRLSVPRAVRTTGFREPSTAHSA